MRIAAAVAVAVLSAPAWAAESLRFVPITPCRLIDTRPVEAPFEADHEFTLVPSRQACGIPDEAEAIQVTATVPGPASDGHLTLWGGRGPAPLASVLNWTAGRTDSTTISIQVLADPWVPWLKFLSLRGYMVGGEPFHLILDVSGYYVP